MKEKKKAHDNSNNAHVTDVKSGKMRASRSRAVLVLVFDSDPRAL